MKKLIILIIIVLSTFIVEAKNQPNIPFYNEKKVNLVKKHKQQQKAYKVSNRLKISKQLIKR